MASRRYDDLPRSRGRNAPGSGPSTLVWVLAVLGVVALLGVCCTGAIGIAVYWQWDRLRPPGEGPALAGWGKPIDPDRDCKIAANGPALTIDVPAKAHDLHIETPLMNAPRVLQDADGDFTIQVKVGGTLRPTGPPTVIGHLA